MVLVGGMQYSRKSDRRQVADIKRRREKKRQNANWGLRGQRSIPFAGGGYIKAERQRQRKNGRWSTIITLHATTGYSPADDWTGAQVVSDPSCRVEPDLGMGKSRIRQRAAVRGPPVSLQTGKRCSKFSLLGEFTCQWRRLRSCLFLPKMLDVRGLDISIQDQGISRVPCEKMIRSLRRRQVAC